MEGILFWLAAGGGALFVLAAVVAWWEHLGRKISPPELPSFTLPPATAVDLDLEMTPAVSADVAQRQAVLGQTLERMTQPGDLAPPPRRWTDTTPMVGPGPAVDPVRSGASARRGSAADAPRER